MAKFAVFLLLVLAYTDFSEQARRSTGDYVIELLVVVDPKAQAPYLLETNNNKADADKSILADIDYFLSEVNKLFSNFYKSEFLMKVSKLKVILLDNDLYAPFEVVKDGRRYINSDVALEKFNDYLRDTDAKETYNYDHALYFSGYDFGNDKNSATVGYAPMGQVCQVESASSIVEYRGTYGLVSTVAHEIGHNLGAEHDPAAAPFIMAPDTVNEDERWTFSGLSTANLKATIKDLDDAGNNCLVQTASASVTYDIPNAPVTAALADPDVVCARTAGKGAYYEPRTNDWADRSTLPHGDVLCDKIYCGLKGEEGYAPAYSSDGWACGKQKTCNEGKCLPSTSSVAAAVTNEACVFGDISIVKDGLSCEQFLTKLGNADFCHHEMTKRGCCVTYAKTCTNGKCTFGDKIKAYDGKTCKENFDRAGRPSFCMEANKHIYGEACCESYPKICADSETSQCAGDVDWMNCGGKLTTLGNADFCNADHDTLSSLKSGCCETYAKTCTAGKCTFGDRTNAYNGMSCQQTFHQEERPNFCINPQLYEAPCCESYPKICADPETSQCTGDVDWMNCGGKLTTLGNADFCHDTDLKSGCCETYAKTCTAGKCTFGDKTDAHNGLSCQQTFDQFGKPTFCAEENKPIFQVPCCGSFATLCAEQKDFVCNDGNTIPPAWVCDNEADCSGGEDENSCNGKTRGLIDRLVEGLETVVAREAAHEQQMEGAAPTRQESHAQIARALDFTLPQEREFKVPHIKPVQRDDIAPLRTKKRSLLDRLLEKLERLEKLAA